MRPQTYCLGHLLNFALQTPRLPPSCHRTLQARRCRAHTLSSSPQVLPCSTCDHSSTPRPQNSGSGVVTDFDPWEIGERRIVGGDNRPVGSHSSCSDLEIMRAPGPTLTSDGDKELRMRLGDIYVVVDQRDGCKNIVEKALPAGSRLALGELDTHLQLGDGDGGDRHVVVVGYHLVEVIAGTFGVNEKCRIKEQPGQCCRSSTVTR